MPVTHRLPLAAALAVAAALTLVSTAAQAQNYRCSGTNGTYYSDRPCAINGGTRLGGIGPVPEPPPVYSRQPQPVARAPDHLSYMSSECASLSDGLRTASSRGLNHSTQADLRNDYQRRCAADEQQARQRWSQDKRSEQVDRHEKQAQVQAVVQREVAQQQQTVAQCGEMRRIIAGKNERLATLTPGEVGDLRRFETQYAARCQPRPQ